MIFRLFYIITILRLLLIFCSHPVALLSLILLQTFTICLNLWTLMKTTWFAYILFLIFLGGLIILFVYVVRLASNEKFEPEYYNFIVFLIISLAFILILWAGFYFIKINFNFNLNLHSYISIIISKNLFYPTIIIIIYLLYTLIVAVKVSSKLEGPLRNTV